MDTRDTSVVRSPLDDFRCYLGWDRVAVFQGAKEDHGRLFSIAIDTLIMRLYNWLITVFVSSFRHGILCACMRAVRPFSAPYRFQVFSVDLHRFA